MMRQANAMGLILSLKENLRKGKNPSAGRFELFLHSGILPSKIAWGKTKEEILSRAKIAFPVALECRIPPSSEREEGSRDYVCMLKRLSPMDLAYYAFWRLKRAGALTDRSGCSSETARDLLDLIDLVDLLDNDLDLVERALMKITSASIRVNDYISIYRSLSEDAQQFSQLKSLLHEGNIDLQPLNQWLRESKGIAL